MAGAGALGSKGAVVVDRAKRWPGVEGDGEDASEAQRYTGELGYAGGAPELHHLHPAAT